MNHLFSHHVSSGGISPHRLWKRSFSLSVILALLLQGLIAVLPGSAGMRVAQAAGPGGTSGSVTFNTVNDFSQECATLSDVSVSDADGGEVRLRASLEDYFDGTEVDTTIWERDYLFDDYNVYPAVSGGVVTLDGSYLHSRRSFNQSGRFVEARALIRAPDNLSETPRNASNFDIGYYRNARPSVEGSRNNTSPINGETAVRLFLSVKEEETDGLPNLKVRLVDGTGEIQNSDFQDPDLTTWHVFRIEWGATDTVYLIDGVPVSTLSETIDNGDTLSARILLFHMNPSRTSSGSLEPTGFAPMQVDWIRGGQYPASGAYTSCVYDAGGVVNFSDVAWDASVPSGTGLTIQTRTSLDNATWSDWSSPIDARGASSGTSDSLSGRYLQYRLNYTSSSLIQTAELRQITFNYYGPTSLSVSPASVTLDPGATQSFTATARDANNREVTGLTVSWSSSVGSINSATGQFTAPLPAGTTSNAVTATVNLSGGGTLTGNASVTVRDLPPTASAGGPYSVDEGSSINLTASGSDPNGTSVSYAWDLDNDGSFETSGQTVSFSRDDNGDYPVTVQVTDGTGQSATAGVTVTVNNVAPEITSIANNGPVYTNQPVQIVVTVSGYAGDTLSYAFDCDDDDDEDYEVGPQSGNTGVCTFSQKGTYTVRVRVSDDDGALATGTTQVEVKEYLLFLPLVARNP